VIRGPGGLASHVIVFETLGAVERRGRLARRRKPKAIEPEPEPEPVSTTRVTLVEAEPFASAEEAERWQRDVDAEDAADEGIRAINGVLHAHRAAAADPLVREVSRDRALVVRVGIGEGEQVAGGRWTAAVALQPPRDRNAERRTSILRPQERLAAILSGRDVALACEELTLRGRSDIDAGRSREAALQLRVALEAAIAELAPWSDRARMGERIALLKAERGVVGEAANRALEGGLDDETVAEVERVLKLIESALRVRMQAEMG
jgi:hypothetical protein